MSTLLAQVKVPGFSPIDAPASVPTLKTTSINAIFGWALGVIIFVGVMVALIFIIYGAFKWITSSGDKQKIDSARKTLIFSIVGLVLISVSLVIVKFIGSIFGVNYF